MSDQTHEQERQIKAKVAAELREATVAEASAEELPDENTVSKAAVYLNTKLPKTRTIAQALVRDEAGGVMLCELSYKRFWDLPGGVVDPHESPAHAVVRELDEELGVKATLTGLRVVSWLPPWRGWDDAMLYVFEATLDRSSDDFTLQRKEIAGIHHVAPDDLDDHVAAYTAKVIRQAVAAADAVAFIGMPEGRIPLAEATAYLATTAKSNAAYNAINAAIADVRAGGFGRVPVHLRDAHYAGAKRLGHGKGYVYPHDLDVGVATQQYLPDELRGRRYYEPTSRGVERDISARLEKIRKILGE